MFCTTGHQERIAQRTAQLRQWLLKTAARETEDRVFRLRSLHVAEAPTDEIRGAAQELLETQRADGGWAQLASMNSDAYATGTALVALHQAGGVATADPAYRNGLRFLLAKQLDDGSWHVATRSTPIQAYYEPGYPHGEDQFISITAAGWATTALALALPEYQKPGNCRRGEFGPKARFIPPWGNAPGIVTTRFSQAPTARFIALGKVLAGLC